ncbi:MAG TPA: SCO family protein [Kofleriaceae bacterium]|nr:SCO family protein [Kofleriaceae bacterium]
MFHRRHWLTGLAALPLARALSDSADASPAPGRRHEPAAPADLGRRGFPASLPGREIIRQRSFPNIVLTTSEGKRVRFYDDLLRNKIVILNLMYADCNGICPTTTANLKRVQQILRAEVKHDIFIYSMTIKPEEDTPDKLREYAKMHGVRDPHWLFLTGDPGEVDMLRHRLGFADPNPVLDQDKSRHSGMLRYGNEPMAIWGTCQSSAEPEWIAQEIGFAVPRKFKRHPRVNE